MRKVEAGIYKTDFEHRVVHKKWNASISKIGTTSTKIYWVASWRNTKLDRKQGEC